MMKPIGKALAALCIFAAMLASTPGRADVTASLDRDRVAMGDGMRLTITVTADEELSSTDLRPLLADFEILQRSTSSNTSIVNGRRTHTRQLLVDITPRREGTLKIPPMRVGQHATNMLLVSVGPAPAGSSTDQTVIFEAEVDRDNLYVQGQVILTLRIQQSINLENRSISELELEGAFVKPLEQNSFQRTMDGRPWLVHEVRYAIFPEQSGTLTIPAQTFSARESTPRRSLFNMDSGGRQLRRSTEPLSIAVLPRPAAFAGDTWLPARRLTLEETWSTPPEQLQAGESATRTIRIQGEGLQGAQLPPILFPATDGLKYYPDQAVISENEVASGLLGIRQDSAALVPTRAGSWSIPEIRIPWWDTEAEQLRYAVLPGREITVAATDPTGNAPVGPATAALALEGDIALIPTTVAPAQDNRLWQAIAALSSIGWLLTLCYLVWSRRKPAGQSQALPDPSEKRAFKQVLAACAGGDAMHARQALIDWTTLLLPQSAVVSLAHVATQFGDPELSAELDALDQRLYSSDAGTWDGTSLADSVRRLRKQQQHNADHGDRQLQLYPRAA